MKITKSNKLAWFFLILAVIFVIGSFFFKYPLNLILLILSLVFVFLANIFFDDDMPKEKEK